MRVGCGHGRPAEDPHRARDRFDLERTGGTEGQFLQLLDRPHRRRSPRLLAAIGDFASLLRRERFDVLQTCLPVVMTEVGGARAFRRDGGLPEHSRLEETVRQEKALYERLVAAR